MATSVQEERASGAETVAQPRRSNVPSMVPLAEFGKLPPLPPRQRTNWRSAAIHFASVLVIVLTAAWWIIASQPEARAIWSGASALDARTQQK
jgi:hypothetical protein